MKKIYTIAVIAASTILATSCTKEIEGELQKEGIIAHASLQPVEATRLSVSTVITLSGKQMIRLPFLTKQTTRLRSN